MCIWVHLYSYRRRLAVLDDSAGFSGPESSRLGGFQMRSDLRSMSDTLKAVETSVAAWRMALKNRPIVGELLFHSDRRVQANPMSSHRQVCMPAVNSAIS